MSDVLARRLTAEVEGSFVVFLVGMRVNRLWKLHRWLPVALAMPRMLRELEADPESGLLGHETALSGRTVLLVQYWSSFEALRGYARDLEREHVPAWASYNVSSGSGDVGVFHETYRVDADDHESVYSDMPAFGLGVAGRLRPATGASETAGERLGEYDGDGHPVTGDGTVDPGDGGE
jgi:hypothetical protein